ncbi:MAG TPA: RHS repeat-associated core domain-containing protein, partial [Terracidiphilus sp.]
MLSCLSKTAPPAPAFQYIYDASGQRVAKAAFTCGIPGQDAVCQHPHAATGYTVTNQYLLNLAGDQLTELDGAGNWMHTNIWSGAHLSATYDTATQTSGATYSLPTGGALHFHISDPLGTRRVQVDVNGKTEETFQSLPFGDRLTTLSSGLPTADDATEHHFTGKERDAESGNDYFGARYYASTMGRFLSPDWSAKQEPIPYAKLDNPQSLNLYQYVGNNPLSKADKDGHCYPVCTAIAGAALGALAEGVSELANHQKLSSGKILAAAVGGGVAGAITGPVGDAVEVGLLTKAVVQVGASVIGGAAERGLTGETIVSKEALKDAAAGAVGGKVEKAAEKLAVTEVAKKV